MADFIAEANALTAGKTLESVVGDPVLLRAFERVMELVGESAKRLPDALQINFPGLLSTVDRMLEDLGPTE